MISVLTKQTLVFLRKLLLKMPQHVDALQSPLVLIAWNTNKKLAAFYVIDLAAKDFANYIIGCYSKKTSRIRHRGSIIRFAGARRR